MKTFLLTFATILFWQNHLYAQTFFQSTEGKIFGHTDKHDTISYKGIPYAKAPIGKLRFKAPRPVEKRLFGLNASSFKETCLQIGNMFSVNDPKQLGQVVGSEDCLYLNIWTAKNSTPDKKPIFFWIHGGSNYKGTSSDPNYHGAYFAQNNDAVFVSINYRLGHFGAFYHPALQSDDALDSSGNYVTLDLIEGLKWIKKNAVALGGDPDNITIAGQSAGCMNVWGLVQSPMAKDLFHKAICSAGLPNTYPTIVGTTKANLVIYKLIEQMGYAKDGEEFLKDKSNKWIQAFLQLVPAEMIAKAETGIVPFQHYSDGTVLPKGGWFDLAMGKYNHVPMIIGATKDEFSAVGMMSFSKLSMEELFNEMLNPNPNLTFEDIIKIDQKAYRTFIASGNFSMHKTQDGVLNALKIYNNDLYRYHFNWDRLPSPWDQALGALHGLDAIFYLGNFTTKEKNFSNFAWSNENKASRERLRSQMGQYFKNFIHHGDPNTELNNGQPIWPRWSIIPFKDKRMYFDDEISISNDVL